MPIACATPRNNSHCQSSVTSAVASSDAEVTSAPAIISARPPWRSMSPPISAPTIAITNCEMVIATMNSVRDHPRSSVIGTKKTPVE